VLIKQALLPGIREGRITLAFRRWRRPTVKTGGTLLTGAGQLAIEAVEVIKPSQITPREALQAGFASLPDLLAELDRQAEGTLYRIRFRWLGEDPRLALRDDSDLSPAEWEELRTRLDRLDKGAAGPWTRRVLELIERHPERKADDLAKLGRYEKEWLKLNVRKLKNLGLTESLNPGYRLSPRGQAYLRRT
jgi:hypothetical protein